MRVVQIKKKSGKYRTIYVPSKEEKKSLRDRLPFIAEKAEKACPDGVAHGFMRGKSPVTNALSHVGRVYTTCFDLSDFFDSVTKSHVERLLTEDEVGACFIDGAPRQGLPTSPAIANLAAAVMDRTILQWQRDHNLDIVYTRYADDLSFSYDETSLAKALLETVPKIVEACGFGVNPDKTRTQCAKAGRRMITGVAVDGEVHSPRHQKRRLRAAVHQKNKNQVNGLSGWVRFIDNRLYERTALEKLVSDIFGENLKASRNDVLFDREGGFTSS